MPSPAQNQMNAIVADLQTLVPNILNSVIVDDMTKLNPLDRNWPGYPSALVIPPTVSGNEFEDQASNLMEYTWYVMVVTTPENLPSSDPTYLAGLEDQIIDVFNVDATLQGSANAAVHPVVLEPPGPVSSNSVTYVVFYVTFKARQLVPAGVQ